MSEPNSANVFETINTIYQSHLAQMTSGISPTEMNDDYVAWMNQLSLSPGKLLELALYPVLHGREIAGKLSDDVGPGRNKEPRFASENWKYFPYRLFAESFLVAEDWWKEATTKISGLDPQVQRAVCSQAKQVLAAISPTNFLATNPDVIKEAVVSGGQSLIKGYNNFIEDQLRQAAGTSIMEEEGYEVGKNLGITPGKVVFRNHLIELIQYAPTTPDVYKEPVLIIPAWIMKYYILDLSPRNSLVKWLVGQGHTVFMVSWRNPTAEDRNLGIDDYYRQGSMAAVDAVSAIVPDTKIHLGGYCLGGTLALITASAMARAGDNRLQSLTLFAAQGDFTEAGELKLFISKTNISFLKKMMWAKGYLDAKQMAGCFQILRSYDLIWSKLINDYMMGKRDKMIDLMAWNSDATRMPYRMHSEYLEKLFLNNDFVEGRLSVEGHQVVPSNIHVPVFAVGTEKDHVVPWRSAFKIHLMVSSSVTFALTSSGHNAGIVSEPGHKGRHYRIHERRVGEPYIGPDKWFAEAELRDNQSWWTAWEAWVASNSTSGRVAPPSLGTSSGAYQPLCDAPGTYVLQK